MVTSAPAAFLATSGGASAAALCIGASGDLTGAVHGRTGALHMHHA